MLMARLERERAEEERKREEEAMRKRKEHARRIKRMLEAAFDGDNQEINKLINEVRELNHLRCCYFYYASGSQLAYG